jgi:hypothetical protein
MPRGQTAQRIRTPHRRIVEVRWSAPLPPSPRLRRPAGCLAGFVLALEGRSLPDFFVQAPV